MLFESPCVAHLTEKRRHIRIIVCVKAGSYIRLIIPSEKYAKPGRLFWVVTGKDVDKFSAAGTYSIKGRVC